MRRHDLRAPCEMGFELAMTENRGKPREPITRPDTPAAVAKLHSEERMRSVHETQEVLVFVPDRWLYALAEALAAYREEREVVVMSVELGNLDELALTHGRFARQNAVQAVLDLLRSRSGHERVCTRGSRRGILAFDVLRSGTGDAATFAKERHLALTSLPFNVRGGPYRLEFHLGIARSSEDRALSAYRMTCMSLARVGEAVTRGVPIYGV